MTNDMLEAVLSCIFVFSVVVILWFKVHKSMTGNCNKCNTYFHSRCRFCRQCGVRIMRTIEHVDMGAQCD